MYTDVCEPAVELSSFLVIKILHLHCYTAATTKLPGTRITVAAAHYVEHGDVYTIAAIAIDIQYHTDTLPTIPHA